MLHIGRKNCPLLTHAWRQEENLKTFIRVSVRYTEHRRSQSRTHLQKTYSNNRWSSVRGWGDSQGAVLSLASLWKAEGSWRHIRVHMTLYLQDIIADCPAGESKTLGCWASQTVLAIVGFGQGLLIWHSLMARPRRKRQVSWIWSAGHRVDHNPLKAAGRQKQAEVPHKSIEMQASARQGAVMITVAFRLCFQELSHTTS